ncbi:MAG: site-specific integrase [Magnetococcales bacterium]|nr:site-specific integrase [Magnetococcales bacterium]
MLEHVPPVEPIPEAPPGTDIPTPEEISMLLDHLPRSSKAVVWFIAETGCRSGEAFNLTWDCIDEENSRVEFKSKDGWTPKTRQSQRQVPIGNTLLDALRALPKRGRYVFPSKSDPNKPRDNVRKSLAAAIVRAGITRNGEPMRITPHVLRKAFATRQAENGTPERVLQAMLGHAAGTRVTNLHYVQATDDAKLQAAKITQIHG